MQAPGPAEFLSKKVTFQVQMELKSQGHLLSSVLGLKGTGFCCCLRESFIKFPPLPREY